MFDEDEVALYGGYGPQSVTAGGIALPGGLGLVGAEALAATPEVRDHDEPTPLAIEGPFYKFRSPRRFDFREPGEPGQIVELTGKVMNRARVPLPGAVVDLWHASKAGDYDNAGFRYRGNVVTNADGSYRIL